MGSWWGFSNAAGAGRPCSQEFRVHAQEDIFVELGLDLNARFKAAYKQFDAWAKSHKIPPPGSVPHYRTKNKSEAFPAPFLEQVPQIHGRRWCSDSFEGLQRDSAVRRGVVKIALRPG